MLEAPVPDVSASLGGERGATLPRALTLTPLQPMFAATPRLLEQAPPRPRGDVAVGLDDPGVG